MIVDADAPRPTVINFRDLFLAQDDEDEESASLADALAALAGKWPDKLQATDIAKLINDGSAYQSDIDIERASVLREFLLPKIPPNQDVSAKSVGKALKRHVGEPVKDGDRTLILKADKDTHSKVENFHVQVKPQK